MSSSWKPTDNNTHKRLGRQFSRLTIDTKAICSRPRSPGREDLDPLTVPIFHTSVYRNTSTQHYVDSLKQNGYIYQSWGNPTTATAEVIINELEGGKGCLMFPSGLSAVVSTLMCYLKCGDHIICQKPCYSGTSDFIKEILSKFGVTADWFRVGCPVEEIAKLVKPNTRLMFGETPCNPIMTLLDLEAFGKLGKSLPNVITVVDASFGSPYVQQPLKYGVNVSIHSCSKYLGGHSDIIGGCATVNDEKLWIQLKLFQSMNGCALAPFDAYLLVRGLKSLSLRMSQHNKNGLAIAKFLEANPKVKKVYYPGLESHPQHEIAKKQMKGFGGMISFEMETLEAAKTLVENVKVINLAASLGGTESLIVHPATMTMNPQVMKPEDRRKAGIADGLVRLSVGLEDIEDLKSDLEQAINMIDNTAHETHSIPVPSITINQKDEMQEFAVNVNEERRDSGIFIPHVMVINEGNDETHSFDESSDSESSD